LKGRAIAVCRSEEKDKPKEDVLSGFFEEGLGLRGDAHAGTEKQVSILGKEKVDQLAKKKDSLFPLEPSPRTFWSKAWIRRNSFPGNT